MASKAAAIVDAKNRNREKFASEMGVRTSGQRHGLFSGAMPLTIGDASSYYDCARRPAEEVGKQRSFTVNRGKKVTAQPFGKFSSNAIGDEY